MEEKKQTLESSLEYLKNAGAGEQRSLSRSETAESVPFMVVEPVETFVGREKDLKELHRIIVDRGVGAITGTSGLGGIGKTELARMYAKRYKADYPDGIFWASLRGSKWQEEGRRIFEALYPGTDIAPFFDNAKAKDEVCNRLNRKSALLVIDNVNEAHEIIRPDCSVLVTTRERSIFNIISRIAVKELDRLSVDDGVKLLMKVLGKARVARDSSGASGIVEILGGMPLALDIAVRHLESFPDLSFTDYIGQIREKIEELKIKDSEDKEVVVSLELSLKGFESIPHGAECIGLFEAAGVCVGSGFTSQTLMETAGLGGMDRGAVEKLCRSALLQFDRRSLRYSMHPLLRQLSEARLKMDESRELYYKENHCTHFLHFSQAHKNSPDMLISEKDGLRQAMIQTRHTGKTDELLLIFFECMIQPFWQHIAGNDYEGAIRYLVMIDLIDMNNPVPVMTDLISILQVLAQNQAVLQESSCAWVYMSLGSVYICLGEYREAIGFYEKALEMYNRIGDARGEGNVLGSIGIACADLGEYRESIGFHEKQLNISRCIGDMQSEGNALGNIGIAYTNLGEYRKAIGFFEKQLEITRRTGDARGEGNALGSIGAACVDLGDYRRAIGFYEKQLEITRRIGYARGEGDALNSIGISHAVLGEYYKAIGFYEKALEIYNQAGELRGEGNTLANMGITYAKMGTHVRAHKCFEASNVIFRGLGSEDVVAEIEEMMKNTEYWLLRNGVVIAKKKKTALSTLSSGLQGNENDIIEKENNNDIGG